jgi:hypothetical protein
MNSVLIGGSWLLLARLFPWTGGALQEPPAKVEVTSTVEEGKRMLVARVTRGGKNVEGAIVLFQAERLLGWLPLGRETTLDDGTAAVPFPLGLPGGAKGELRIRAKVEAPADLASLSGESVLEGSLRIPQGREEFPRALWAPHAPVMLILIIFLFLGAVWGTYVYVFYHLWRLTKGGTV